jgi:gamma-glutamylcyclotransferase (GGCT)/AIG2-like uncharacterized protein YtfP
MKHYVLSYGSNLNIADWTQYCQRQGKFGKYLKFIEVVKIPDYRLVFDKYSQTREGGVLNIRHAVGYVVEAGLFETNDEGLSILQLKEGVHVKNNYQEKETIALRPDGSEVQAKAYIVPKELSKGYVRPSAQYLELCKQGYEFFGLPTDALLVASDNKSIAPLNAIFCYGTLMRGEPRFSVIKEYGVQCALLAQIFGRLSTNGSFPALDLNAKDFAWGDYFVSRDISNLLRKTDKIEGFIGYGTTGSLYRRTCVDVDVGGSGQRLAWVYVRDEAFSSVILSNDWRHYNQTKQKFYARLVMDHLKFNADLPFEISQYLNRYNSQKTDPKNSSREAILTELLEGANLTEKRLAQHSNLWTAVAD